MERDPVVTIPEVCAMSQEQLARIGKVAATICAEGRFDLTDSPLSFMENIKTAVYGASIENRED